MHWLPRQINKKTGKLCSGHNTILMKEKRRRNKAKRNNDGVQPQGFGAFTTPTFQVKAISDNPPSLLWSVTIRPDKVFRSVEAAFKKFWRQHNNNCSKTVQFSQNKTWRCRIFFCDWWTYWLFQLDEMIIGPGEKHDKQHACILPSCVHVKHTTVSGSKIKETNWNKNIFHRFKSKNRFRSPDYFTLLPQMFKPQNTTKKNLRSSLEC